MIPNPEVKRRKKQKEQQKTFEQPRGYWTEFAKQQKLKQEKENNRISEYQCQASAPTASRQDAALPARFADVRQASKPPDLDSMKVKSKLLLPGSNLNTSRES